MKSTILMVDGKEVRPTEQDVDMCIEYLKRNNSLICYKTVSKTVSQYKKGEIDITQQPEQEEIKLEDMTSE